MATSKFQITIIDVGQPTFVKTAKGGYSSIEVAFRKDGKVEGKKLMDFVHPEVYKLFRNLKGGAVVNVVSSKGEEDKYWNWSAAEVASGGSAQPPAEAEQGHAEAPQQSTESAGATTSKAGRGKVTGSTYETPGERALRREADRVRQYYIVRQSSVSAAIAFIKEYWQGEVDGDMTPARVIEVAKEFEAYVFTPVPAIDTAPAVEQDAAF